jgi:hypothetical protein
LIACEEQGVGKGKVGKKTKVGAEMSTRFVEIKTESEK